MTDSLVFFSTAVLILVIGFLGHLFFKRTGWPETLFLIGMGIMLGPMLHVFAKEELLPALPLFSTFTLITILFQSGMGLNLFEVVVGSGRIVLQTTANFLVGMMAIALFLWLGVGWDWLDGLLMGSIVAQTGAVVIVPLASKLNVSPQAAVLLSLEATLTSIYNIVFFFVFLEARIGEVVNLWDAASFILIKCLIGIGIGVMLGVAFLRLFVSFEEEKLPTWC